MTNQLRYKLILLLSICSLYAKPALAQDRYKPQYLAILDTSKGRQLLAQCSRAAPTHVKSFWVITSKEQKLLERKFKRLLTKLSRQWGVYADFSTFHGYCVQCVGVVIHHKRFIYISAFKTALDELKTDDFKNWQTEPIVICNGGDDVWGILLNVRSKSFSQLEFNGIG